MTLKKAIQRAFNSKILNLKVDFVNEVNELLHYNNPVTSKDIQVVNETDLYWEDKETGVRFLYEALFKNDEYSLGLSVDETVIWNPTIFDLFFAIISNE